MKKIIISFILAVVSFAGANAQNNNVRRVEFEIGAGFNKGAEINGAKADLGIYMFMEARLNVIETPFDVGLQTMITAISRGEDIYGRDYIARFRGSLTTFVDYNFRRWKNIAPFVGLGIGFTGVNGEYSWSAPELGSGRDSAIVFDRSFILNPRIGVEFFDHLRITFEYKLMRREYSYFGISIGGVLGGGQKK